MTVRWQILTGEYPPQAGGVSDYTRQIARGLAQAGDEVQVWAPADPRATPEEPGVRVHRLPDHFGPRGLAQLDAALRREPRRSRVLVQYVPHMYGYKAMNLAFCSWLRLRVRRPWVMFHEVTFPIRRGQQLRHNCLGSVNHAMAALVAGAAERIFVSVPRWGALLRSRFCVRRPTRWLPVPSNVPTQPDPDAVRRLRARLLTPDAGPLLGHFGSFHPEAADLMFAVLPDLLRRNPRRRALMIGQDSVAFVESLARRSPDVAERVVACADLPGPEVSQHLAACDLLLQPYVDGVSSRRSSAMAGLALGQPVLTTQAEATEPVWRNESLVELVPLNDRDGFSARAEDLLASPELRERLGRRALAGYEAHFSCRHTIAALREDRFGP